MFKFTYILPVNEESLSIHYRFTINYPSQYLPNNQEWEIIYCIIYYILLQSGGQSGVWTVSVIILSIGTWVGRVGPRPADGELALLTSPRERLETVRQVLSEVPLIDGHNDLPWNIRNFLHNQLAEFDFDRDLRQVAPWSKSAWSQTDLVRLRQGMVGGQVIAKRIRILKKILQ